VHGNKKDFKKASSEERQKEPFVIASKHGIRNNPVCSIRFLCAETKTASAGQA
jgi:hypothetical protein